MSISELISQQQRKGGRMHNRCCWRLESKCSGLAREASRCCLLYGKPVSIASVSSTDNVEWRGESHHLGDRYGIGMSECVCMLAPLHALVNSLKSLYMATHGWVYAIMQCDGFVYREQAEESETETGVTVDLNSILLPFFLSLINI